MPKRENENYDARSLWNKGVSVKLAISKFYTEENTIEYDTTIKPSIDDFKTMSKMEQASVIGSQLKDIAKVIGKSFEPYTQLRAKLAAGRLLGIGFREPRLPDHEPTLIPADVWESAKVNTDQSFVKGAALSYVSVRIAKRPRKSSKILSPLLMLPAKKQIGRPRKRDDILNTYEELKRGNKIDFLRSMKQAYELILETMRNQNGDPDFYVDYETVRIAITTDFQQNKNNKLSNKL